MLTASVNVQPYLFLGSRPLTLMMYSAPTHAPSVHTMEKVTTLRPCGFGPVQKRRRRCACVSLGRASLVVCAGLCRQRMPQPHTPDEQESGEGRGRGERTEGSAHGRQHAHAHILLPPPHTHTHRRPSASFFSRRLSLQAARTHLRGCVCVPRASKSHLDALERDGFDAVRIFVRKRRRVPFVGKVRQDTRSAKHLKS